jgi:hypothetical protein
MMVRDAAGSTGMLGKAKWIHEKTNPTRGTSEKERARGGRIDHSLSLFSITFDSFGHHAA